MQLYAYFRQINIVWPYFHETPEFCGNKGGEVLLDFSSWVPFTSLCVHSRKKLLLFKFGVSVQIQVIGLGVKIKYGGTFNVYTKNASICLWQHIHCKFIKVKPPENIVFECMIQSYCAGWFFGWDTHIADGAVFYSAANMIYQT